MTSGAGLEAIKRKLSILTGSLDELEGALEPLLAKTLPENLLDLEPIQQAKLQVLVAYLVYDLVFSAAILSGCFWIFG
jgi:exosome complex protein LRP1